jgi:hypothetical protein
MILIQIFSSIKNTVDKFYHVRVKMTQTGMVAVRRVPTTGVPCMKILQLRKNPMQHSPPQKHRKVARFYSRGLGPPRLEPHVLPTNALGPCTRPTRPSPSFPRTQQPNHFFALSIRAIRTVHHALQRLIAVRSPLRRSSFFPPLLSREHIPARLTSHLPLPLLLSLTVPPATMAFSGEAAAP